jgi:crotonobetainyl-CoA:carnitine CoA-transferase CaiB-like acyl-CoA transferase
MKQLRVAEFGDGRASAYCGRLFAGTGAEVVVVEPDGGYRLRYEGRWAAGTDRSMLHEFLAMGKRSIVGRDRAELEQRVIQWADVVISDDVAGRDSVDRRTDTIMGIAPSVVHVIITGFGMTGPCADWRTSALIDWAAGGYLFLAGDPNREPIQGGGPWASYLTGATAAVAAQAAVFDAIRTGDGQVVDISAMESVASAHQWTLTMYTHTGAVKQRWGARFGESHHPMSLYRCADDRWICIGAPSRDQWENFCVTVGIVELLADDDLYKPGVRFERADEIDRLAQPWLDERTAKQAVHALQANRVPASEVLDYSDVLGMEQLAERNFLRRVSLDSNEGLVPGVPFVLDPAIELRPAPDLGADWAWFDQRSNEQDRRSLPKVDLSAIRVAEFSVAWAGPLAGRFLGDVGLDVVKVEHPYSRGLGMSGAKPDAGSRPWQWGELAPAPIRSEIFPDADPGERPWNRMGIWNKMNRSKRSLCLDAKAPGGNEIMRRVIESSDIVLHNFSPRGAISLGIDEPRLEAIRPEIVSVAMTGYGESGPMRSHISYGPILEAAGGFNMATGYPDDFPLRVGVALPDAIGGVHGAFAVLAALWEQRLTGSSVHVDLSQLETALSFAGDALLQTSLDNHAPQPIADRSRDHAPQGVYRCAGDDVWIALTVDSDEAWAATCHVLDLPGDGLLSLDVTQRHNRHDELDTLISAATSVRSADETAAALQRSGVVACPAYTSRDLVESPQLIARGFMVEFEHQDIAPRSFPGRAFRLRGDQTRLTPPPRLGEHNAEVLSELGFDSNEIDRATAAGTLSCAPPPT